MYEQGQAGEDSDDVPSIGRERFVVRARLEPEPSAESALASACAVSWSVAAVFAGRGFGDQGSGMMSHTDTFQRIQNHFLMTFARDS